MNVCNNENDYFDGGYIDNEISNIIEEMEGIKENIKASYNNLASRTREKVDNFSYINYELALGAVARLNNSRHRWAENMISSTQQMESILNVPSVVDMTHKENVSYRLSNIVLELYNSESNFDKTKLPELGELSTLVAGVDDKVLANYREENTEIYKQLIMMYSALGPLTSHDISQIINAGNCGRFNQNSHLGRQSFYSLDPNKLMVETFNKDENRYIKIGNKNWATLSTSGCGPSALYNCINA